MSVRIEPIQPALAATAPAVDEAAARGVADDRLMERVKTGDEVAFSRIVERYKGPLTGYLGRLTGDRDRADELAQEVFVRLFQAASSYRSQGRLAAYLYRIATNLVRSEQRRRRRWRLLQPLLAWSENGSAAPEAPRRVLDGELHEELRRQLAELPVSYRAPLLLYEVEELPYAEIAEVLGCREGTVKSRIYRARQRLKKALAPYVEGGGA